MPGQEKALAGVISGMTDSSEEIVRVTSGNHAPDRPQESPRVTIWKDWAQYGALRPS